MLRELGNYVFLSLSLFPFFFYFFSHCISYSMGPKTITENEQEPLMKYEKKQSHFYTCSG